MAGRSRRRFLPTAGLLVAAALGASSAAAEEEPRWRETLAAARESFEITEPAPGIGYGLPHKFLFVGSETVRVGDVVWERGRDYRIDYDAGTLTVLAAPPYAGPVVVEYEYLPFLQSEDYRTALEGEGEAEALERIEEAAAAPSELDVTGSKTFTVTAGNFEGKPFTQSLRLSIRGNVGDVKVTGEISDQDLPFEEGGATEEIEAVDKIFVRVEGRHLAGTFGDYDAAVTGRRFADYQRRLTGIKAEAFYPTWRADAYGARARGRFATNEFYGVDGVQGPYQLSARDDDDIIILPGTETVWLNGAKLKEGENNDYIVDYDLATITFTVRRPISAEDRIVVDFQYTTEEYQRNFFGAETEGHFAGDAVNVGALYLHEEDDRAHAFFGLDDYYRKLLEGAGDDQERARVLARDENGEIIYEYVGEGRGEYSRQWDPVEGKYVYLYVGPGNGDFMPRTILLPFPKRHSLFDVNAVLAPTRLITVEAEGATSDLDANTFSSSTDQDNSGLAGSAAATVRLDALEPLKRAGELEVRHVVENRDTRFQNLGREDAVAFLQQWDLDDEVAGLAHPPGYNLHETTITERPVPSLTASGTYGGIRQHYVGFSANGYVYQRGKRVATSLTWEPDRWPHVAYDFNHVRRRGPRYTAVLEHGDQSIAKSVFTNDENTRREQSGEVSYSVWRLSPYVRIYDKKRRADYEIDNSPDEGTLEQELEVGTGVRPAVGWAVRLSHIEGRGKKVEDRTFVPHYRKNQEHAAAAYDAPGLVDLNAEYTKIRKDFASADEGDVDSDLSLLELYYTPLERALALRTRYELNSVQDLEREEIFEVARDGDGDYRREPDPKNPNRYVYIYDPDDPAAIYIKRYRYTGRAYRALEPDLTVSLAVLPYRFNDVRGRDAERDPWLDAASADLYFHARNSSASPRRFAVATLQDLLASDSLDSSLEQRYTLTLLPVNRRLTGRARYSVKDDLDRTIASRQRRRWRTSRYGEVVGEPAPRLTVQADVDRVREWESITEENVPRPENTIALEMIYGLEPTYSLTARLDLKVRGEVSRRHEEYNAAPTHFKGTRVKPEATYRLTESGVANAWYERTQYDVSGYGGSETSLLRIPGVTHKWETSVNKGVGRYVTLIFTYDGEKKPDEGVTRHRGRIDLNIYF
ncbi:MAG TPA: hypothetical protein VMX79_12185 [bacterium]|nr:hypothetical protein [bacterium]